jgi:hypothetical protein
MIEEKELFELYRETAHAYRKELDESQFKAWVEVLSKYSYTADVDAALRRWTADTLVEDSGWIRGARMPYPAEIKASIEDFEHKASLRAENKFVSCGKCEEGWVRVFRGKTAGGNSSSPKFGAVRRCACFIEWLTPRKKASWK